jgi:hypothetical protein
MPFIRGANVTYTAGLDRCLDLVTDGTHMYTSACPPSAAGKVVKTAISPFAQTSTATLSVTGAPVSGCTVLGGHAFTTHAGLPLTTPNAGLVKKTNTTTMLEVASTQLWSPGPTSRRQTVAIYNDGTFLYVGSEAYDPGTGWLATQITQMDTSFGSQTTVSPPTMGTTILPSSVDGDGSHVYFTTDSQNGLIEATNSVLKLSTSGFAYVSRWEMPYTTGSFTDLICIPPKLYVGVQPTDPEAPGIVYRINTSDMTSDGVVITQQSGIGGMLSGNGQLYISSLSGGAIVAYDLGTYDRVGTFQLTPNSGAGASGATVSLFKPDSQGTVVFWGLYGSSSGGVQEYKNTFTGYPSTYPVSPQPVVGSGGVQGTNMPNVPTTRQNVSIRTGGQPGGGGSNTGNSGPGSFWVSSTNSFLQAMGAGDPHFYGFEGESWFFNGESGSYYNLFSDEGIQINSLFRHWETSGGNNFTAMEEIGITIITSKVLKIKNAKRNLIKKSKGESIKIKITANEGIAINGEYVCDSLDPIIEFTEDPKTYFTDEEIDKFNRTEGYGVFLKAQIIRFWPYHFIITKSTDGVNKPYLNIIAKLDGDSATRPHGIIGQTADYDGKPKAHWDGEDADYKVADLWSDDFKFNKFKGV